MAVWRYAHPIWGCANGSTTGSTGTIRTALSPLCIRGSWGRCCAEAVQGVLKNTDATPTPSIAAAELSAETLLRAVDLHKAYGDIEVLKGVSLDVRQGEVLVLIGRS